MKEYTVFFHNGDERKISCSGKKELVKIVSDGDEKLFKEKVDRIIWSTTAMHYVEDVKTNTVNSQITSADVNPYGWRNN